MTDNNKEEAEMHQRWSNASYTHWMFIDEYELIKKVPGGWLHKVQGMGKINITFVAANFPHFE